MKKLWAVLVVAGVCALLITVFADLGWAQLLGPRVPGGPQVGGPPPGGGGPPSSSYSRPPSRPRGPEDTTGGGGEAGGTVTYDLPRARRMMGECEQLINQGKQQLDGQKYREAIAALNTAKKNIELVRGWYQEQTETEGGTTGAATTGATTTTGIRRTGAARPATAPAGAGGEGEAAETLSGLIPPEARDDLLRARTIHANILLGLGDAWIGTAGQQFGGGRGSTNAVWQLIAPGTKSGEGGEGG